MAGFRPKLYVDLPTGLLAFVQSFLDVPRLAASSCPTMRLDFARIAYYQHPTTHVRPRHLCIVNALRSSSTNYAFPHAIGERLEEFAIARNPEVPTLHLVGLSRLRVLEIQSHSDSSSLLRPLPKLERLLCHGYLCSGFLRRCDAPDCATTLVTLEVGLLMGGFSDISHFPALQTVRRGVEEREALSYHPHIHLALSAPALTSLTLRTHEFLSAHDVAAFPAFANLHWPTVWCTGRRATCWNASPTPIRL
jgi:hypothetical protein